MTSSDAESELSKAIKLLKSLKSWFRVGVLTEQDLYAIVGHLNEKGTMRP